MKIIEQFLPNRLVIENKGAGPIWEKDFFLDIQRAIVQGYRIAENNYSPDTTMRNFQGFMGRAVLYRIGFEPLAGEPKGVARKSEAIRAQKVDTSCEGGACSLDPVAEPEPKPEIDLPKPEIDLPEVPVVEPKPEIDLPKPEIDLPEVPVVEPEDPLSGLTKKDELLKYAKEIDLKVSKDLNIPSQIKKFIKENRDK